MKKLENGERLGRKVGSGQPRMFSDSERQKICEFARSKPLSSSSKLSQIVAQETGKTAHRTTVAKYLFSSGYVQKLPKIVPELNEVLKQKRKTFSRDWAEYSFEDVFLTDESVFQLHRNTIKVWCLKDEKPKNLVQSFAKKLWYGVHSAKEVFTWKSLEAGLSMQKSNAKLWMSLFLTQTVCILDPWARRCDTSHRQKNDGIFWRKKYSISAVASQFPRRKSHRKRLGNIEKCSWAKKSKNQARTDWSNTEFQKCHHEGNQRKFDEFCWKASKVL